MTDDTLPGLEPDQVDQLVAPAHADQLVAGDDDGVLLELPGLEDQAGDGAVLRAARQSLRALEQSGLYTETGAVMGQALLTCARQLDRATAAGTSKDYGVAQLVAQLRETWSVLVPIAGEERAGDGFALLAAELREAAANARRQPVDGPL